MVQILFILFLLIIGYSLRFAKFPEDFGKSLNLFVIYISFPATILLQVPNIEFNNSLWIAVITPWSVLLLSILLVLIFFRHQPRNTLAALLLLIPLGNTSFFGFPMLEAVIGKEAIQYAIVYDQLGSFFMLSTYGAFAVSYFSGDRINIFGIVKKIALFPPFIFLIFSFIAGPMPQIIIPYIELLSHTLVPLALISVGFSMQLRLGDDKAVFAKALFLKLVLIPLITIGVFAILGIHNMTATVTLLEAAMPPMITAGALAIHAGFAPRLSAALVGYGIVVSLITIPLLYKLILFISSGAL
ncbi:MAG: AEC family transporter [Campylobacterales bacterium]|nr:AEC family transporter [Campylobacterales bacterium]